MQLFTLDTRRSLVGQIVSVMLLNTITFPAVGISAVRIFESLWKNYSIQPSDSNLRCYVLICKPFALIIGLRILLLVSFHTTLKFQLSLFAYINLNFYISLRAKVWKRRWRRLGWLTDESEHRRRDRPELRGDKEGTECISEREEKEKKSNVLTNRDVRIWLLPLELWLSLASLARQKRLCEAILSPAKVQDKIKFDVRVNASTVSDPRLCTALWAIPNRNDGMRFDRDRPKLTKRVSKPRYEKMKVPLSNHRRLSCINLVSPRLLK